MTPDARLNSSTCDASCAMFPNRLMAKVNGLGARGSGLGAVGGGLLVHHHRDVPSRPSSFLKRVPGYRLPRTKSSKPLAPSPRPRALNHRLAADIQRGERDHLRHGL